MTYKEKILLLFDENPNASLSCTQVKDALIKLYDIPLPDRHYLSGYINNILNEFVKSGILKCSEKKTPRGRNFYEISEEARLRRIIADLKEKIVSFKHIINSEKCYALIVDYNKHFDIHSTRFKNLG